MKDGSVIADRFRLDDIMSRSGTSELHRGMDLTTNETVAVKILRPSSSSDSNELLQRRLQEFRMLHNLKHPNAVNVLESGLTKDNIFYVAMEYLEGNTLREILDSRGPIPADVLADYLDQLAGVLDQVHEHSVVHRNIKPENMMIVADENGNERLKLLGFAFAKILSPDANPEAAMTQAGMVIGTPAYISPEQAMGRRVTKLADIYAVGVSCYELLTGKLPFYERSEMLTLIAHVKNEIPRFTERNPSVKVPEAVEAVVRQTMAKHPPERPGSIAELAKLFREALGGKSTSNSVMPESTNQPSESDSDTLSMGVVLAALGLAIILGALLGIWMSGP
ncbi:Serine/threonine-protein kinase PrkC [Planctomycetes bacterium Pan216]|uniref:Serine/threonine-protein kinase PrkC n=1 Tax=Kolteria novifilia TaxID=2527975 RepID=A0A518B9I4_9BACT|nr:Serine/threonine-protein kinase PrkC [Planctomycetes bacterium Pan216]